jgi:hypothetical protein
MEVSDWITLAAVIGVSSLVQTQSLHKQEKRAILDKQDSVIIISIDEKLDNNKKLLDEFAEAVLEKTTIIQTRDII